MSGASAISGFDLHRLGWLNEAIDRDLAASLYDGCVVLVARRGGIVLHEAFGHADKDAGRQMTTDAVFHTASVGKQFVSALALNHVERGTLRLPMPVRQLIPEIASGGKERVTLYQLLNQTSGVVTDKPPGLDDSELGDLAKSIAAICDAPAVDIPGQRVTYSAYAGTALIAEMIRRADGGTRSWRDVVKEELFAPLGMHETAAGLPRAMRERVCPIRARSKYVRPEVARLDSFIDETTEIPGGCYTTTAVDLHRFALMLLNGGVLEGERLLSPAMLDLASMDHTGSDAERLKSDLLTGKWPPAYGLGFLIRGLGVYPMIFGTLASPHTFGGMGHGSNFFWVDRERDVCMIFLSTGLIDEFRNIERGQRYSDIVLGALTSW